MKKLRRADAGIDYIKLLADHSRKYGIREYSGRAIAEFGDAVEQSLAHSTHAQNRVRGLRAEALFLAVVASIGKVTLIKSEDAGDLYYAGADQLVPDFRIVLKDGRQLLVEVKAVSGLRASHKTELKLSDAYVQRLLRYTNATGAELRVAIFWEDLRLWTMNSMEAFHRGRNGTGRWAIGFGRAMAANEMATVGDYAIGTEFPLKFRVLFDPDRSDPIPANAEGTFTATIAGIQLLSRDKVLRDVAARIAWKLLWYGDWDCYRQEQLHDGGRLVAVDHLVGPQHLDASDADAAGQEIIAWLSGLISTAYLHGAATTIHSSTGDPVLEPGYMRNFIPENFMSLGLDLPLLVMELRPNYDFKDEADNP